MEIRLDGKVALVTGASTGIGAAIAIAFGEAGARVALHYNTSRAEAEKVASAIRCKGGGGDPTREGRRPGWAGNQGYGPHSE